MHLLVQIFNSQLFNLEVVIDLIELHEKRLERKERDINLTTALNRVDFPTLGRPTIPALRLMLIRAREMEKVRVRLHCHWRASGEEEQEVDGALLRVNPRNPELKALATTAILVPSILSWREKRERGAAAKRAKSERYCLFVY